MDRHLPDFMYVPMFGNDTPDEPAWSDNLGDPSGRKGQQDPPDEAGESEESRFGFDRSTAVYWAAVFGIAVCILLFFIRWLSRNVSGKICIGDATLGICSLANVAIDELAFVFLSIYGVTAALWVVRAKPRDAHPWLVTIFGWLGAVAGYIVALGVANPVAGALQIRAAPLRVLIIALIAAAFVALSTLLRPRRPARWWRRLLIVALPITSVCFIGVTLRSDHEIRGIFVHSVRNHIHQLASQAADSSNRFPERQRELLARQWLEQPEVSIGDEQAAVLEEHIGQIDAVGHGRDFRLVVEHVLDQAAEQDRPAEDVALELVSMRGDSDGLLQNIHVIGRRASGYCMAATRVGVDDEQPFEFVRDTPIPRALTHLRLDFCVVDDLLFSFDRSGEAGLRPRQVGTLSCPPPKPPHPYAASATERDAARFLSEAFTATDLDDQVCPAATSRPSGAADGSSPGTFAREFAGGHAVDQAGDETKWGRAAARALGFARRPLPIQSIEEESPDWRADFLYEAVARAQRGPALPRQETLIALFGDIVDTFSSSRVNRIIDAIIWQLERSDATTGLEKLASGIDVARFVVGESRSGWCVYRLHAEAIADTDADDRPTLHADLDYQLRYCLAGTELYAFDADGGVERSWDASDLPRRAPLFDPTDTSRSVGLHGEALEKMGDRNARDALIKQFLDGLVDGDLTDVSQLETLQLARGADLIEASTNRAMRRMLGPSSDSADEESEAP